MVGQGPKTRTAIVEEGDVIPEISSGFLRTLFAFSTEDMLKFLAHHDCLHNGCLCPKCAVSMTLVKASDRSDGFKWRCPSCKSREKSVRAGSFFDNSKLPIDKLVLILYSWSTNWGNNTFLEEEIEVDAHTAVTWLNNCRQVCEDYLDQMPAIGGENVVVESDQMA